MTENNELLPTWATKQYKSTDRAKNYALVVYPDDMPENWLDTLKEPMYDLVISPYHDKDINPDGTAKKPHYHILVSAGTGWVTMNQLAELGRKLKGIAKPQKCSNPKGMVRYFTHIDNPEKAQYEQGNIQVIGQYDISEFFKPTAGEDRNTRREIVAFVVDNHVTELADLVTYTMINNERWDDYIARNTIYINAIIKSVRHKK